MTVNYFKKDIRNVTGMYYEVIIAGLRKKGVEIKEWQACTMGAARSVPRKEFVLATDLMTFIKLYFTGHRNFIYWFQGITPEESYMNSGSKWKYLKYSFIEKLALKTVKYKFGVSKYLFEHYENKYGIKFNPKELFIMPCFNSDFNVESFNTSGKYENNIFTYAGGMQAWQGFEDIVKIYKAIEEKYPNVFLKVLSKDIQEAQKVIDRYDIKHYSIGCVPQDKMEEELAECKFGFIIRENHIVNNVATPTKLGTYIGNGVIPVYTPTIKAFADLSKKYDYLCCAEPEFVLSAVEPYITGDINIEKIKAEYTRLYKDYYGKEGYIEKMSEYFDF